jgi:NIPSNAP
MKRRDLLLAASGVAGAASLSAAVKGERKHEQGKTYYELRKYQLLNRSKQKGFHDFFRGVAIPALNRAGIEPVGVFNVMYGPNQPMLAIYVLLPHKSLESFASATSRLAQDSAYQQAGSGFLDASYDGPAYVRMESSLMVAFDEMPGIELPPPAGGKEPRIFELRTYESHNAKAGRKKIEMFNSGGEIALFRQTGLNPVFFGETLVGPQMPNLTYMLCFRDMVQRDSAWKVFVDSPGWKDLSVRPEYKDTVSNITDIILRPMEYSQI